MRIELPARLEGDDVLLRRLRPDDAPAYVAAFRADPELGRLLGMEEDPDEERVRKRAEAAADAPFAELAIGDPFAGTLILHFGAFPCSRTSFRNP